MPTICEACGKTGISINYGNTLLNPYIDRCKYYRCRKILL